MRWPLPALLSWAGAWLVFLGLARAGLPPVAAALVATALGGLCARWGSTAWRRVFIGAGFPVSLLASGAAAGWPGWLWLAPLALLLVLYPLNTWRDAPLFPTPRRALEGLAERLRLPTGACVVDAGCGLGAGLRELHRELPDARVTGWEWSWPLTLLCRLRCRFARVQRRDIWAADWSAMDLVYLFQRPESMPRAWDKARRELKPGAWLASLEFEVPGQRATARLEPVAGKPVWLYRMPGR
jgi:SAM-dependent methyltransferase